MMRAMIAFAALTLWAAPAGAQSARREGEPIGLSGANSVVAPTVIQASQLAVDEINAKGGVMGRSLALDVKSKGFDAHY